jgi:hypothetical protein
MVKIIGFHGIAGAGKDTAAFAIKELEQNTDVFAFAGPLKEACKILFNFSHDQLHHPVVKEELDERWEKSPRQILQWLGTDILRNHINQDFFVMNMKQRIEASQAEFIIISDVRFDNEAEFIRSLGGKVIKIERNMTKNDGKTTKHSGHITERGISSNLIDAVIENNASIEEFKTNVMLSIKFLFKKPTEANHANHFVIDDIDEVYPRRFN